MKRNDKSSADDISGYRQPKKAGGKFAGGRGGGGGGGGRGGGAGKPGMKSRPGKSKRQQLQGGGKKRKN